MTSSHVKKLEVTEMKMCRWTCEHTLRDHVRKDDTGERLEVESITERSTKAILRRFGYIKRREEVRSEMDGLCERRHESHRNNKI